MSNNIQRIIHTISELVAARQQEINRYQTVLDTLDEQANKETVEGLLKDAKKKPSSISLVKAFLSCDPNTRNAEDFANTLKIGLSTSGIRIKWLRKTPEELAQQLKDDWIDHCMKSGNQHLTNSPDHIEQMGVIAMLLGNRRYKNMKINLPRSEV